MIVITILWDQSNLKKEEEIKPKVVSSKNKEIQISEKQIEHNNSGTSIWMDMSPEAQNKNNNDMLVIGSVSRPKLEIKTKSKMNFSGEVHHGKNICY